MHVLPDRDKAPHLGKNIGASSSKMEDALFLYLVMVAKMLISSKTGTWWRRLALLVPAGLVAGCASLTTPKVAGPVFFPPPPDTPRLQFLTSLSSSDELGERNWLLDFLVGKRPNKILGKPYGVAVTPGRLYIGDTSPPAVEILDLGEKRFRHLSTRGISRLLVPANVAVDNEGNLYVSDTGRGQILIFGPDERYVNAIGIRASANAPLFMGGVKPEEKKDLVWSEGQPIETTTPMKPAGLIVAGDRLYVADLLTHSVRVFDRKTRQQLLTMPTDRKDEQGKLYSPTNLALDQQGCLYVSDTGGFRILKFDAQGKFLRTFGRQGNRPGECMRPKGVAVDRTGRVYVVDAAAQVVQIFDAEGNLLMYFGAPDEGEHGLILPAGIALDYANVERFQHYAAPGYRLEYLVIVVSQFGGSMVNVYGFLQPH